MLLKTERNQLFQVILDKGLKPTDFTVTEVDAWFRINFNSDEEFQFEVNKIGAHEKSTLRYRIEYYPGWHPGIPVIAKEDLWENGSEYGILPEFRRWISLVKRESEAPDLWLEITKAIQLFESAAEPAADKFSVAELGALHGQLRMLAHLFETSELLREHQAELSALIQTAAVKAETFTKKDWQNWIKGAFISAIASLELTEEQTQELLALVRLAFGGLFLKQ